MNSGRASWRNIGAIPSGDGYGSAEELPEGDVSSYRYVDGEFIYDPVPVVEVEEQPTQLDRIEAQLVYTAMMTDTLLEV